MTSGARPATVTLSPCHFVTLSQHALGELGPQSQEIRSRIRNEKSYSLATPATLIAVSQTLPVWPLTMLQILDAPVWSQCQIPVPTSKTPV
jgi:hypothetical protein